MGLEQGTPALQPSQTQGQPQPQDRRVAGAVLVPVALQRAVRLWDWIMDAAPVAEAGRGPGEGDARKLGACSTQAVPSETTQRAPCQSPVRSQGVAKAIPLQ